ncbi:hypothetical protein M409DRAFT_24092 [Zasmidium cellare ATCC 36951]|uniref:PHD-type domain-containing protein n=1 Tax=Zasmidium cellare ATCC 36951 TaxID=1080233 RepID=A0A6A6CF98_ZASCE|nr:uncharacterized protein M409DRAFT_24092 [Zasmidium cellare ATCC 36951]KAF2165805.1 hypothetical protein M409DRAFT_24092 [Zasmidium cellare ATCC 36951]
MDEPLAEFTTAPAPEPTNDAQDLEGAPAAPPSSSVLSDAPTTDAAEPDTIVVGASATQPPEPTRQPSAQTEELVRRINENAASAAKAGTPPWEAAREAVMKDMVTSEQFAIVPARGGGRGRGRGRGGKRASFAGEDEDGVKIEEGALSTPGSGRPRGRGGRPRGRGRGTGRSGKRKRDDEDDGASDSSDEVTPIATMTKSGRSIQKPSSFVPPPPQSPTTNKRKRPYNRRNPENAVCKSCLRGTSPASNMIVFCDGCNTPYHRYCHKPPIDQAVIDQVDKEWYCSQCESDRIVPVPEAEVAGFVSVPNASAEERQKYFSSLTQGMLVTLMTKATTLQPDLPVFEPAFKNKIANSMTNGHSHTAPTSDAAAPQQPVISAPPPLQPQHAHPPVADDANYGPEVHPPNYPRPGQGLMKSLPPEQEDLQWLVEDDDRFGVFTHLYQADATAGAANGGA